MTINLIFVGTANRVNLGHCVSMTNDIRGNLYHVLDNTGYYLSY